MTSHWVAHVGAILHLSLLMSCADGGVANDRVRMQMYSDVYDGVEFLDIGCSAAGTGLAYGNRRALVVEDAGMDFKPFDKNTILGLGRSSCLNNYTVHFAKWDLTRNALSERRAISSLGPEWGLSHDFDINVQDHTFMALGERVVQTKDGTWASTPGLMVFDKDLQLQWMWDAAVHSPWFVQRYLPALKPVAGPQYRALVDAYVRARATAAACTGGDWFQRNGVKGTDKFHLNSLYWDVDGGVAYLHGSNGKAFFGVSLARKDIVRSLDRAVQIRPLPPGGPFQHLCQDREKTLINLSHSWKLTGPARVAFWVNRDRCAVHADIDWKRNRLHTRSETCMRNLSADWGYSGTAAYIPAYRTFLMTGPRERCAQEVFEGTGELVARADFMEATDATQAGGLGVGHLVRMFTSVVGWVACGDQRRRLASAAPVAVRLSGPFLELELWAPFHVGHATAATVRCDGFPPWPVTAPAGWQPASWTVPTYRLRAQGRNGTTCAIQHELASADVRLDLLW